MRLSLLLSAAVASTSLLAVPVALATTGCNAAATGFSDVRGCVSAAPAIEFLRGKGSVEGYPDGTFRPDGLITRAELTKLLVVDASTPEERSACVAKSQIIFPDVPRTEWFAPYVCVAKERGIVSGYPDGGFAPHAWINYAEAAKIAATAYKLPILPADAYDHRWYAPYASALLARHAVPPTVEAYDAPFTRGEMAELRYRLDTGRTSLEWFSGIEDGDDVRSDEVSSVLRDVSFSYPGSLFSAKEGVLTVRDIYVPGDLQRMHSLDVAHVRRHETAEGCNGMAGPDAPCRPSVSKLAISVGVLDRPLVYARLGFNSFDEDFAQNVTVDGRQGVSYFEGLECEGWETTFVPMDATRTLVIVRSVDCNQQQDGYLSSDGQDQLFRAFLDTVDIAPAPAAQEAPTMEVSILLCPYGSGVHDVPAPTVKLTRTVPQSSSVADMTLRAMLHASISADEKAQPCNGVWGFSGDDYRGVVIQGGTATVRLARPLAEIFQGDTESSTSAQRAISANLKQFPSVKTVRYVVQP